MATHISQCASSEVVPRPPVEGMIGSSVKRTRRSGTEPAIPIEVWRQRIRRLRAANALRPDWPIAPNIYLRNRANDPGLNHLDSPAKAIVRAALIPHLGHEAALFG